jgi:hypothetical protein
MGPCSTSNRWLLRQRFLRAIVTGLDAARRRLYRYRRRATRKLFSVLCESSRWLAGESSSASSSAAAVLLFLPSLVPQALWRSFERALNHSEATAAAVAAAKEEKEAFLMAGGEREAREGGGWRNGETEKSLVSRLF